MSDDRTPSIAEVVWVERMDGRNHIKHAKFDGERWHQASASLYSSDSPLTNPTIGTKANGNRLLIWVEQIKNKTVLQQMTGRYSQAISQPNSSSRIDDYDWSKVSVLSDLRLENFAPSVVVDAKQTFWVVWSSSSATQSDIFIMRELGYDWSSPVQVNPDNLTPDLRPIINNDILGNIYVAWTGFDQTIEGFTKNSAFYSLEGKKLDSMSLNYAQSLMVHNDQENSLSSITIPGFLPKQSRILVHFPQNKLIQSIPR